jgi:hypothetical protein
MASLMGPFNFIDEINRLFDELIVEPWRPQRQALPSARSAETEFEVAVPAEETTAQAVSVSLEGSQLTISVHRDQARRAVVSGAEVSSGREEHYQRIFPVQPGAVLRAVQTHFDKGQLHIRIRLGR